MGHISSKGMVIPGSIFSIRLVSSVRICAILKKLQKKFTSTLIENKKGGSQKREIIQQNLTNSKLFAILV